MRSNRRLELGAEAKRVLGLSLRKTPDLYENDDDLESSAHADAIKVALRELGVSAVFCVQGAPAAAVVRAMEYDPAVAMNLHAALWNQGLASVLVVIDPQFLVRIFSLGRAPIKGTVDDFEARTLVATIRGAINAIGAVELFTGLESGRFIHENRSFFPTHELVDSVLLENLLAYSRSLQEKGLGKSAAQALLSHALCRVGSCHPSPFLQ